MLHIAFYRPPLVAALVVLAVRWLALRQKSATELPAGELPR